MLLAKLNEKHDISMAIYIRFTLGCKRWEVEHQDLEWLCKYQWNAGITCIFIDANLLLDVNYLGRYASTILAALMLLLN
ncbi:hypothetical protein M5J15_08200 [Serratia symbiotica]|uniref:hypothetical protein n=1 Tax=Serratia symbiotica TaxID=138074 RepID=UPI001D5BA6E0|nr:hypothetical protein [Serratia symbiotica]NIG87656.1 hypothetical protein [Serratia symbiotica]USS96707.1 hypothetical protein M5J15_08200 [Serratia symbiotica]